MEALRLELDSVGGGEGAAGLRGSSGHAEGRGGEWEPSEWLRCVPGHGR